MKDKLYKNNHRGIYYRLKAFFFAFAIFSGAMAVAVIPTYIALKDNVKEPTHAQVEEPVEEQEENPEEEVVDTTNLLSF